MLSLRANIFNNAPAAITSILSYSNELEFKRAALEKIMQPLISAQYISADAIALIGAPTSLAYRNRIQLHYRHKYIGMINAATDQVVEVPQCKIIRPELQAAFDALYQDKSWAAEREGKGHCELYLDGEEVKQTWNGDYAEGGFTQVNDAMNKTLKQLVCDEILASAKLINRMLDLFSGNGNLSEQAVLSVEPNIARCMVDMLPSQQEDYLQIDLFSEEALKRFAKASDNTQFDMILVDPAAQGFFCVK